jgi:hypothetical protein
MISEDVMPLEYKDAVKLFAERIRDAIDAAVIVQVIENSTKEFIPVPMDGCPAQKKSYQKFITNQVNPRKRQQ